MSKTRIGLIVDDEYLDYTLFNLIERSRTSNNYSIEYLLVQCKRERSLIDKFPKNFERFLSSLLFSFIQKFEFFIFKRSSGAFLLKEKRPYTSFNIPIIKLFPHVSQSGLYYSYIDDDVQQIKSLNLDALIRGGSGILRGSILQVCRYGVISLHHGDNRKFRGGPAGFWEVLFKSPSTGFIIQKLNHILDGGQILYRGSITTQTTFSANQYRILKVGNHFLHLVLNNLKFYVESKNEVNFPYDSVLYRLPTLSYQIDYLAKSYWSVFSSILNYKLGYQVNWNFGFVVNDQIGWSGIELRKIIPVPNKNNSFFADPFIISHNDKSYCFVEEYSRLEKKAFISVFVLSKKSCSYIGPVLNEKFHLSFPHVFKMDDEFFMLPETCQNGDIRLYRCLDFPMRWELSHVLVNNVSAADSTVFYFDNLWYLFTNIDSANIGDHSSELHIYFSDDLKNESWSPHPCNPVVHSPIGARNAGSIIILDGMIIRPSQAQGFNNYGESIFLNEIELLNPTSYKERRLTEIEAKFMKNIKGTHTFNVNQYHSVVDYSTYEKV
jgi:hypothetical protein